MGYRLYTETEEENSAEETLIPWNHELSEISDPLNVIQGSSTIIEDSIAGNQSFRTIPI